MTYYPGPWESESERLNLDGFHRKRSAARDNPGPHPIIAPIAWVVCLLAGAAFWAGVFELLF